MVLLADSPGHTQPEWQCADPIVLFEVPMLGVANWTVFFADHPDRDTARYGAINTVATGGKHASYLLLPRIAHR